MSVANRRIQTKLIHGANNRERIRGSVVPPIFQSSTYELEPVKDYHDIRYLRFNNTPSQEFVSEKLAELEEAEAGLVTASGMAAISTSLLTGLSSGDHLIALNCLYGGSQTFIEHDLRRFGISATFVDGDNPEAWWRCVRPNTRAFYVETMTNPLLQIPDLDAVIAFARAHELLTIIDNTFATPLNFRPLSMGFDVCVHSCSKFLNGHNDIVAGAILGKHDFVRKAKKRLDYLGGSLDPHACFLLLRGLKTLAVRLRTQEKTAMALAELFDNAPAISKVNYPGLTSHVQHKRACEFFDGFGAMISFEMTGGAEASDKLLQNLSIPIIAPSLGGVESLIIRPAGVIYAGQTPDELARTGVGDGLVRLSVGLEDVDDLIADFQRAMDASN